MTRLVRVAICAVCTVTINLRNFAALSAPHHQSSSRPGPESPLCRDAGAILMAALEDRAGASDLLGHRPPTSFAKNRSVSRGQMVRFGPESAYWRVGWIGRPPSQTLVRRWYHLPYGSIADCFGGGGTDRSLNSALGMVWNPAPADGNDPSIILASYPALDDSGTHALLLYSRMFRDHLGGRVELVALTSTPTGWRKTGWQFLGAS